MIISHDVQDAKLELVIYQTASDELENFISGWVGFGVQPLRGCWGGEEEAGGDTPG